MRRAILMLPLLVAACSSGPFCSVPGSRDLSVINNLIRETEGNLRRGYAIEERDEIRTRRTFCDGVNDDGTRFRFRCEETDTFTVDVPVTIDLAAEQAKLDQLLARRPALQARVDAGRAQCAANDAARAAQNG